jgi:hypothetical protein
MLARRNPAPFFFTWSGLLLSSFWSAGGAWACNDVVMGFLNKLSSSLADRSGGSG